MHTHQNNGRTYTLVTIPEGANRFHVFNDEAPYLSFFVGIETPRIYLPPGNYSILCRASEATEEQAAEVVEQKLTDYDEYYFCDYLDIEFGQKVTARGSLNSLLESKGLKKETTLILQQK